MPGGHVFVLSSGSSCTNPIVHEIHVHVYVTCKLKPFDHCQYTTCTCFYHTSIQTTHQNLTVDQFPSEVLLSAMGRGNYKL